MGSKRGVLARSKRFATLFDELRNFGREPKLWRKPATPAQKSEKKLASRFATAKHRQTLSSSQIQELKAIWASDSAQERDRALAKRCAIAKQIQELKAKRASNSAQEHERLPANKFALAKHRGKLPHWVTKRVGRSDTLFKELRNFGREPKRWRKPATPAQKHERSLAIWASNSGDKHPVVTMAQGSSEGGRGIKRICEEGHAEPNSGGEHSGVTKRMIHASCGDRRQLKRLSQEEHAHMPPRKRMRWKQPAPNGGGQPPANSSCRSTGDGHSAVGGSIQ